MGAAVAVYAAAHRTEVAGLVSFAGPAETRARTRPAEDVERMREMGIIRDPDFPPSLEEWANEGLELSPAAWVSMIAPRPLLILQGDADDVVPPHNADTLYERAGEGRELADAAGRGAPLPQRAYRNGRGHRVAAGAVCGRRSVTNAPRLCSM